MLGGTKFVKVPTAREVSKIFTDHTFLISQNSTKLSKNITGVPTVHSNFQKIQMPTGGSVNFWGAPAPISPRRAIPALRPIGNR